MSQPNNGKNEAPTSFHGHKKRTHEANTEEHQVYQDSRYTPKRRGTNGNIGDMLQPRLHQNY